jgi:hypothetical protein
MLGVFMARDLVMFYFFWELVLIPMFLIIGVWAGARRVYAGIKFFLYTFIGSLFMLVADPVHRLQDRRRDVSRGLQPTDRRTSCSRTRSPTSGLTGARGVLAVHGVLRRVRGEGSALSRSTRGCPDAPRRGADGGLGGPGGHPAQDGARTG